jgi:hypothetical protein
MACTAPSSPMICMFITYWQNILQSLPNDQKQQYYYLGGGGHNIHSQAPVDSALSLTLYLLTYLEFMAMTHKKMQQPSQLKSQFRKPKEP